MEKRKVKVIPDSVKADMFLNAFTKIWCNDKKETDKQHDLVFRCNGCEFENKEGDYHCLIKQFHKNHSLDEHYIDDFGSMSR